jgi:peroxiredoxin
LEAVDENGEIRTYKLSELTDGAIAVLNVYVYDYSPVCTDQVCDLSELEWLTINDDVNVVGLSGDGPYSHQQFIEDNQIGYPLLCDTAEEIIEELGVIHEEKDGLRRVPQRSMFLVNENRRIRWKWVAGDNWDNWNSDPIEELNDEISQLRG